MNQQLITRRDFSVIRRHNNKIALKKFRTIMEGIAFVSCIGSMIVIYILLA